MSSCFTYDLIIVRELANEDKFSSSEVFEFVCESVAIAADFLAMAAAASVAPLFTELLSKRAT